MQIRHWISIVPRTFKGEKGNIRKPGDKARTGWDTRRFGNGSEYIQAY